MTCEAWICDPGAARNSFSSAQDEQTEQEGRALSPLKRPVNTRSQDTAAHIHRP